MRRFLLSGVALVAVLCAGAYADDATTDVNSMVDQLAPKAEASSPSSAVLSVKSATEQMIVARLQATTTRSVSRAAQAIRLPSPGRGHELEILRSIAGRPALQVAVDFQGGSDALAPESTELLGKLAAALNDPKLADQRFLIGVHTDLVGSDEYNLDVADLRARAIAGALVQQFGLPAPRLETVGFGRVQASEDNGAGSQIRVVNLGAFATAPASPVPVARPAAAAPTVKMTTVERTQTAFMPPWDPNAHRVRHVHRVRAVGAVEPVRHHSSFARPKAVDKTPEPYREVESSSIDVQPVFFHGSGGGAGGAGGGGAGGGGGGGGGGSGGGGGWSDRRLKRNVVRLGATPDGLPLYRFQYVWGGPDYVGVMAQDLMALRPDAVILDESGYYRVDYDKLGFQMLTLEDYERRLAFA